MQQFLQLVVWILAICSPAVTAHAHPSDNSGSTVKDLRFEIPLAAQNKDGIYIRILLGNTELFRGDLAAVKAGDFNFTVPDSVMQAGENKLIVEFFAPPSEVAIAQSILVVDIESDEPVLPSLSRKRVLAAVGTSAVLGLALRRALRSAAREEAMFPPAAATAEPQRASDTTPLPPQYEWSAPNEGAKEKEKDAPSKELSPFLKPTSSIASSCAQLLQREFMMKQVDNIKNNKIASIAVGTIILSRLTSSVVEFGRKEKVESSPVAKIIDRNFGKARNVLRRTWNAARRMIERP